MAKLCGQWERQQFWCVPWQKPVSTDGQTSAIQPGLVGTANKRRRKDFEKQTNESDTQIQRDGCNED